MEGTWTRQQIISMLLSFDARHRPTRIGLPCCKMCINDTYICNESCSDRIIASRRGGREEREARREGSPHAVCSS